MSQENVEVVRKVIDTISAREVPEDLIAPDIQVQNVGALSAIPFGTSASPSGPGRSSV